MRSKEERKDANENTEKSKDNDDKCEIKNGIMNFYSMLYDTTETLIEGQRILYGMAELGRVCIDVTRR